MAGESDKKNHKDSRGKRKSSDKGPTDDPPKPKSSGPGTTHGSANGPNESSINVGASGSKTNNSLVALLTSPPVKTPSKKDEPSTLIQELRAENKATADKLSAMVDAVQKLTEMQNQGGYQPLQFELHDGMLL